MGDAVIIFHRVMKNLIENAFRHTPSGGSIELGYRLEEKVLVIYLKDTGPGIPEERRETIFERGVQGAGEVKGKAGLGLYNARKVVEAHHGKLWVESQVGKGSTFYFTLPLAPPE
jgi:signal transduction histidine kinase